MLKIKVILAAVSILIITLINGQALAKVYIDIDSPAFKKFPIAIADYKKLAPLEKGQENLTLWFPESLAKLLDMTNFFSIINRRAFLEDQATAGIGLNEIKFPEWTAIGAEYLVKGGYRYTGGQEFEVDMYLYDVIRGAVLVNKKYKGNKETKSDIVRQFAGEILLALTGDRGVFDTKIAFMARGRGSTYIYTINFDGSGLSRVTSVPAIALALRWSPDNSTFAFTSYKDRNPDLYVCSAGGGAIRKISGHHGINLAGGWSPDNRRLAVTLSKDGNEEIYVMDTGSKRATRLTHNFAIDVSPSWSPDGGKIAFVSDRAGSPQIYIMGAGGGGARRLTTHGSYNTSPSWSPKGKTLAFEGSAGGFQIFTIDEDGSNLKQLTSDRGTHESPSWSPDGRFIVYSVRGRGLYIINADGSSQPRLLFSGSTVSPSWSSHLK